MSDIETLTNGLGLSSSQLAKLQTNLQTLKTEKLMELDSDVARAKEGMHITQRGLNILAKAMAGKELKYSRVAFGDSIKDGKLVEPTDAQILKFESLINEREMSLPIADVRFAGNGTAVVTFQVNNATLKQGFWARELGIFVIGPDSGQEYLYAYKNTGALSTYIPAGGGAVSLNLMMNAVTVIDQATNVTAIIDADLLFVSQTELLDHINSTKPHPNVPNLAQELTTSNYIWVGGSDTQLHPMSAQNLQTQILGDNIQSLALIKSRTSQNEINIANLFAQLNAEKELGLDANLLLVEDFEDCDTIDMTKIKVLDQVAGSYQVCVETLEGLMEGFFYTISDGSKSQSVRVVSLASNDGVFVAIFNVTLNYTFNLKKCYLYRSSGAFGVKSVNGSGDVREEMVKIAKTWTGSTSNTSKTITFETKVENIKNFELSGYYSFTDNGYFTLK